MSTNNMLLVIIVLKQLRRLVTFRGYVIRHVIRHVIGCNNFEP
jgi:hypothetical protein